MNQKFEHLQAAHCENGVTTNLLQYAGVKTITEPLAFGIGSGIFYVHIPFLKVGGGPAIAYRTMPGLIFKRTCQSLGIEVVRKTFSSKKEAETELVKTINAGQPVGCQVGVYYLTYFPKEYRFHFNAHNLIVFGKEGDDFLISDPVMEYITRLTSYELDRVRFAKGPLAPRGQLYYPKSANVVTQQQIKHAITKGIKRNVRFMLHIPGGMAGVSGIRYTGKKIMKWRDKLGIEKAGLYLAQLVRMQEEIGTGGGGFRYIYAAFLQQAHAYHAKDELMAISEQFTESGDKWRNAAVQAAAIFKGRLGTQQDFNQMGEMLFHISALEKKAFTDLSKIKWT